MRPYYRVGNKNPMNIYLVTEEIPDGYPVGVFFDRTGELSLATVQALNAVLDVAWEAEERSTLV